MLNALFVSRPGLIISTPLLFGLECQLPDDPDPISSEPDVLIQQISAGLEHTCVVADSRRVRCWGSAAHGKLGRGKPGDVGDDELPRQAYKPFHAGDVDLGAFGPIAQLAGHDGHTCALNVKGAVRCWGYGPVLGTMSKGIIGDDEPPSASKPLALGGPVRQLAAGALRTCALLEDGSLRCWGDNSGGELGYGHTKAIGDDETPASAGPVPLGASAQAIAGGGDHFCAITFGGAVRCWGQNNNGQLGHGHTKRIGDNEAPASAGDVDLGGDQIVQLALGGAHSCALTSGQQVRCWGLNKYGQLGYGHTADIGDDEPAGAAGYVAVDAARTVVQLAAGAVHTCALLDDGAVKCWGYGLQGQLGYGDDQSRGDDELPTDLPDVDVGGTVIALSMGTHTCALLDTGRVRCWGPGGFGQLGYGNVEPVGLFDVPGDAGDVAVF